EIRDAAERLRKHHPPGVEVLPLFARLSQQQQDEVFAPHSARRIVLATNVAETSLTVPGIRFVIDAGTARIKRYSFRSKVEQLPNELGAPDGQNALTTTGRELARLPLDPRIGRMILEARHREALREVLIVASALSVQDVRDRPLEQQQAADRAHAKFDDDKSE